MVTGVLFSVHDLVDHFLLLEYSLLVNRPGGEGGGGLLFVVQIIYHRANIKLTSGKLADMCSL